MGRDLTTAQTARKFTKPQAVDSNWIQYTDAEQAAAAGHPRACSRCFGADARERRGVSLGEAELPTLPFPDGTFDLAVCSHLLFLYTNQLGDAFHLAAIREMCRVAAEVRIFPLLALGGQRSPYVETSVGAFRDAGFAVALERVSYEFQRGGNQMLRTRRAELTDG